MPAWESEPRKILRVVRICFVWVPDLMKAFDIICHGNSTAVNLSNATWAIACSIKWRFWFLNFDGCKVFGENRVLIGGWIETLTPCGFFFLPHSNCTQPSWPVCSSLQEQRWRHCPSHLILQGHYHLGPRARRGPPAHWAKSRYNPLERYYLCLRLQISCV